MDASRKAIGDESISGGVSMYLSFDSNSTMSNAAYKTMEAFGDISASSTLGLNEQNTTEECHQDSTLEAANESRIPTVKMPEASRTVAAVLDCTLSKNILQEFRAISSTPSKEQLLRTVDIIRGSDNKPCLDLGVPFVDIEKESNAFSDKENKENAQPESELSGLSVSGESVVGSVIERNQEIPAAVQEPLKVVEQSLEGDKTKRHDSVDENNKNSVENEDLPANRKKTKSGMPHINTTRKPLCEPNLNMNLRSSTSGVFKKRVSGTAKLKEVKQSEQSEIPKLLDQMMQISSKGTDQENPVLKKGINKLAGTAGRRSLLPLCEKRPFSFTQRMSIVVKTTLNSPARKAARKSLFCPGQIRSSQTRRSVTEPAAGASKACRRSVMTTVPSRRSMIPTALSCNPNPKSLERGNSQLVGEAHQPSTGLQSAFKAKHLPVLLEQVKNPVAENSVKPKAVSCTKLEPTFSCNVCSSKFRIKSLLDAHKRCHDDNTFLPADAAPRNGKNCSGPIPVVDPSSVQCKYCDKKFAIVRALHIHLLEKCAKIPPGDKKKLHFTELNHVEKAQLPPVFSNVKASAKTVTVKSQHANGATKGSVVLSMEKKDVQDVTKESFPLGQNASEKKVPLSSKLKKTTAHSGVYLTPSKSVPCHLCKQSFKSVFDYTNHIMVKHSSLSETLEVAPKK